MDDWYSRLCKLPETYNKQGNIYSIYDKDFLFYISFPPQGIYIYFMDMIYQFQ